MDERIISNNLLIDDEVDVTLRQKSFGEYIGQKDVKEMV
jgi:Holliday junction resolvasome RuvABC ATP-dependent DNA helicase subunit